MNFMEKLLDGVDVEWKRLGDVLTIKNGRDYKHFKAGNIPVYGSGGIMTYIDTPVYNKPSVLIPRKGSLSNLYYVDVPFWTVDTIFWTDINTSITEPKFIYYYLQTQHLEELNMAGGVPSLTQTILNKVPIPIPCPSDPKKSLEIQAEIVRILDTFTELTAELTAELKLRKKQYGYYRDRLLNFESADYADGRRLVEWKTLGEVAGIYDSLHQTPLYSDNGFSMIRVTDIKGGFIKLSDTLKVSDEIFRIFTKKYSPKKNDLVMSRVGSYGNVSIVPSDNSVCMGQNTVVIHPLVNGKFLYYILLASNAQTFIARNVGGGSQKTLSLKNIKEIPVPLPPLAEQARIVAILDKFDALTTSITEGLPREIELRQKQYEYYRNMLLSFPKAGE